MDFRAQAGAVLLKFFKIGRLTFGSGADSLRDALGDTKVNESNFWKAYETNVWAYRGINEIAESLGQLPIRVVEETAAGNLEVVKNHPFAALIENPNPFMTRQDLVELLVIFLESTGDGYWLFDDGQAGGRNLDAPLRLSQVKEIWPIPSHQIAPIADADKFISGYKFKPERSGKTDTFSTAEVLKISYPSPASLLQGQGAIRPITSDLAADAYALNFEKFIMKNLAANIVFLKTASTFAPDQREEYRRALANVFKGVKIAFMENGLDFANPQIAAKDLPFLELDARRQRRILGALGVPPIRVGSEDAKYDNAEQQNGVFWGKMVRKTSRIGGMLTKKLHELGENNRLSVILDTSGVKELQSDYAKQATTAKSWFDMGVPVNTLVKVFGPQGLEEVEGGDVGLVPSSLIPLMDAVDPPEPPEAEGTPDDAPPPMPPTHGPESDMPEEDAPDAGKGAKSLVADKAMDDAHWKRFIATSEPGFRRLRAEMRRFFKAQKAEVLARLRELERAGVFTQKKDARVDLIVINVPEESKKLQKKTSPILKAIYQKLGKQAVEDVGASISFNVSSTAAAEFLSDHVAKFTFDVNKTTRDRVTKILVEKFETGSTQAEITSAIQAEFEFAERYRAARIARTESGIAGNSGFHDGMIQAGVERKRWISSRDAKVRHSHEVADGQEVGINDPFDVGGSLLDHPGDPNGPADEIINCRCAIRAARHRS